MEVGHDEARNRDIVLGFGGRSEVGNGFLSLVRGTTSAGYAARQEGQNLPVKR